MMFIIVFVSSLLIVPLAMDYRKHGRDNIINRSSHEVIHALHIKAVKDIGDKAIKQGNEWLFTLMSLVVLLVVVYLAMKIISFVVSLLI